MKALQERVKKFCEKHRIEVPLPYSVLDMASEVGEVAKEILEMSDYGKSPLTYQSSLQGELGDVFYSLITI